MDGAMGQEEEDVVEAVLTCEGDFHDPELNSRIERFRHRLKDLLLTEKQRLQVKKIEPWNSVKVTFTIPRGAALRLRQLAQNGNDALRQMGVLSVQIQGDSQISLTIAGRNNESTQLLLCTPPTSQAGATSSLPLSMVDTESAAHNSEDFGSSSSSDELTRKNIVNYLRQGSVLRQNPALFDTILGTGAASVAGLGFCLDIPQPLDPIPGPSGSNATFRPNNIASTSLQNSVIGGSHLNSSFPFTKTTGAFHPPVPRTPFSAGQRSATNSTHLLQSGNINSGRLLGTLGHDAQNSRSGLSNIGSSNLVFQHNMNTFSPVGAVRLSPGTSNTSLNSLPLHTPPSSSPSSFMIDLPPPPPYPSTSSMSWPGKPVTSSSPLLVNLLQTDPMTVGVGLASGNPNKPLTAGDLTSGCPAKKKQQSRKMKDGLMKSYFINDSPASNKTGAHPRLLASDLDVEQSNARMAEDMITSRLGSLPGTNRFADSFIISSFPDSKPLFSSDRPISQSSSPEEHQTDFGRAAIGVGCSSSRISDSNGQEPFPLDLDPFSMEIAAGKIINPYTGQLEPRDSVVENAVQVRASDPTSFSQGDTFATQILARKAKELKKMNENSVPNLSSQVLDVHVVKTAIPTHINVSTSTAAFVHSGGSLQTSSDKLTSSVSSHRRHFIGDGSVREIKETSLSSNVYAVTKPWQEMEAGVDISVKTSSHTLTNSSPRNVSASLSSTIHKNFAPAFVPFNGPLAGGQIVRHNMNLYHQHIDVPSCLSGLRPSPQGSSVIYSSVTKSSSLPLPVSHHSHVAQTQSQQSLATTVNHVTAPSNMQNSVSNTVSVTASISHTSQLGSTSFSSSQPPLVQVTDRLKTDSNNHVPHQHNKAAGSDKVDDTIARKTNSPDLLNSLPDKHIDSQSITASSPDNKTSSDGDENSNHSGLITDALPEHSGTAALLEHSGVKAENHDSGVGSSSERSDDTPSEPGDSEFRSGQAGAEIEDSSKTSSQKTVNCKMESKVNSISHTITIGYMVSPNDGTTQSMLTQVKDIGHVSKTSMTAPTPPSTTASDISQFFHAHIMSMDKQSGLLTGNSQAVDGKGSSHLSYSGQVRENGQGPEDMNNISSVKMNGPSSKNNIEKMIKAMSEMQHKKARSSPKQNNIKGLVDVPSEHLKLQTEVLEKMCKLHQFAESTKEISGDVSTKQNSSDKSDSPDALSQRLISSEDRPDQLIFDMEQLVNGKTIGHGGGGMESKGGSNITSIYSKRSSPVNVNMLNHIYAPGLPLPRRLTESVQRLVKPLPAAETSVSYSQVRPCKSPGSGGSPRAGSGTNIQSCVRTSAVRSPGASTPKLMPSDKHSLLSGGLDLAGLPSLKYAPTATSDHTDSTSVNCKRKSPALTADVLLQDPHFFPLSQSSPPNLFLDSKSYSGKMLSQSYPPCKSRDLKPNITHMNHGLIFSLQSNSSFFEKNISSSVHTANHSQLPRSKIESSQSVPQDNKFHPSNRSHQDIMQSNHLLSVSDPGQARLAPQQTSTAADNTHSISNSRVVDNSSAYTSHSNASSPVMPILQKGLEPPVTPTVASSMPNISSQPPFSISSANEISAVSIGCSVSLSDATDSTNKHVPYSNNTAGTSGTPVNATAKSTLVSTSSVQILSTSSVAPSLGKIESSPSYSASPRLSLSPLNVSAHPKLKKTNNPLPSSSRIGSNTPQFSRNLFESVSGTLSHENISSSTYKQLADTNSVDSLRHGNTRLAPCGSDSKSDSFSSVLVSHESKEDLVGKSTRHKSTDGGDKTAMAIISHTSKTELTKAGVASKPVQTSHDLSLSTFLTTEVVNLDFSLPPQTCNAISLNIGASKGTSCSGNAMKTSSCVPDSSQEPAGLQSNQPSTSSLPSVSHNSSGFSLNLDNMAEIMASVTSGKEEAASKLPSGVAISSIPLVKEPILETLASSLGSPITKTSIVSPGKSFVKKQVSSCGASLEFQRVEEEVPTESKMVTIQSGPHRPQVHRHRQVTLDLSDSMASQSLDPFNRKPGKKWKSTNSDDESEVFLSDGSPVKQPHFVHSIGPAIRSMTKSPTTDTGPIKADSYSKTDSVESKEALVVERQSQPKPSTAMNKELIQEKELDKKTPSGAKHEDKDPQRHAGKPRRISTLENKEQGGARESRPHRSLASGEDSSDEGQSNRSSSNESRGSSHKESRFHYNTASSSGADSRERQVHHTGTVSTPTEDKDSNSSVDHMEFSHKDTFHKDSRFRDHESDNKEICSRRSSSVDDTDATKHGKDISTEKLDNSDKGLADDGQRKSHRIKRQFYAYVPEKSIDQTYFDTPILSGRTRSKNKPSDMLDQDTSSSQDEAAQATTSTVELQVHHPIGVQQAAPVKADGSSDSSAGKRPTRSVRAKDTSQDQNASKRRRVQQHR